MAKPQIFVSHSHHDNALGLRLVKDLRERLGKNAVWYDDADGGLQGGDPWWSTIVNEITKRDTFIVILSPDAVASDWVPQEMDIAFRLHIKKGTHLLPLAYRRCALSADWEGIQSLPISDPDTDPVAYAREFDRLLATLGVANAAPAAPPESPVVRSVLATPDGANNAKEARAARDTAGPLVHRRMTVAALLRSFPPPIGAPLTSLPATHLPVRVADPDSVGRALGLDAHEEDSDRHGSVVPGIVARSAPSLSLVTTGGWNPTRVIMCCMAAGPLVWLPLGLLLTWGAPDWLVVLYFVTGVLLYIGGWSSWLATMIWMFQLREWRWMVELMLSGLISVMLAFNHALVGLAFLTLGIAPCSTLVTGLFGPPKRAPEPE